MRRKFPHSRKLCSGGFSWVPASAGFGLSASRALRRPGYIKIVQRRMSSYRQPCV